MTHAQLVCIVDDSADYRFLLQQLFSRFLPVYPVHLFAGGQAFLNELPKMSHRPSLILLDRHMPGLDGHQTLLHLKQHSVYQRIPVVMMSADATPVEINSCYEAGVNSFLGKEVQFDLLKEKLSLTCRYWLEVNQGPY